MAWQATTFSLIALIVGVPLGIASGRWAWSLVANSIGSALHPTVPALLITVMIPATLVVCNVVAAFPGWAAARVAPATIIRSE